MAAGHRHEHAFGSFNALVEDGVAVRGRRNLLKASLAGIAGLSVPTLLQQRAEASRLGKPGSRKSVILLWMAGGPSHIDTWDPKPDRPLENRGPFSTIPTKLSGVRICEHLPKMAGMLDKFTLIRSVNARGSNHEPNVVFQTGNKTAESRENPEARKYPSIASLCAKHHGANVPGMPPYVAFSVSSSHLAYGGYLGKQYDPFMGNGAARLPRYDYVGNDTGKVSGADVFALPYGLNSQRIIRRSSLRKDLDGLRARVDAEGHLDALDRYEQQAVEMVLGGHAREAFDLTREPDAVRERYGKHLWQQQALLARRLVEAGVAFVTLDLSHHPASGTWDTHGDNIPPYGGIKKGLQPLLPLFDHLVTTLVSDLHERGLSDEVLVIAMGEFGRTPQMGTQESSDGRDHWAVVMSMALAGGGLRHGQVIGATEPDGSDIAERPVTPADLAATIYRHMGVPLEGTYDDHTGRPRYYVDEGGAPIRELF